jgi:hypothetical protein
MAALLASLVTSTAIKATNRRGAIVADWTPTGLEYVPTLRFDWSLEEAGNCAHPARRNDSPTRVTRG